MCLSKYGLKGQLNEINLIYPNSIHNHGIDKYISGVHELKTEC